MRTSAAIVVPVYVVQLRDRFATLQSSLKARRQGSTALRARQGSRVRQALSRGTWTPCVRILRT
eukprot:2030836-Alexandrium_andersonii.AAC.1